MFDSSRGLCIGADPVLWDQDPTSSGYESDDAKQAKAICRMCPIIQKCLDWALATRQRTGIWGGLNIDERRLLEALGTQISEAA